MGRQLPSPRTRVLTMGWTAGPFRAIFSLRLTNQPGLFVCPARVPTSSRETPNRLTLGPGRCLPGGRTRVPRTMPQVDVARAALPPGAARAAQPLILDGAAGLLPQDPQQIDGRSAVTDPAWWPG